MALDFREFTTLAIHGLNKKAARRVAKALDVAIAFGAISHATDNPFVGMPNLEELQALAATKMEELRRLATQTH